MNRSIILLFVAWVSLAGCKRGEPAAADVSTAGKSAADMDLIDYDPPRGNFSCRAPGAWKALEAANGTVTFIGPRTKRGGANIHILQYPHGKSDQWSDAAKYAESFWEIDPKMRKPDVEKKKIGDNTVLLFHQERPFYKLHSQKIDRLERHDYALIPIKGGFFEIWHSAPSDTYLETLPVFEAVVRSFKPKI